MAPFLLFLVMVNRIRSQWVQNDATNYMPYNGGNGGMAVAQFEGRIYLVGGDRCVTCLIEYDIATGQWIPFIGYTLPRRVIPPYLGEMGYYAQLNDQLYIVDWERPAINVFNLKTKSLQTNWTYITIASTEAATNADEFGCLTSNSTHLHFIGGHSAYTMLILDVETVQWWLGPRLLTFHFELSCAMHPSEQIIYAFGGLNRREIEKLNIETGSANFVGSFPDAGIAGSKAVTYNNMIYIFGGYMNNVNWGENFSDKLFIFDPNTDTLVLSEDRMNYGVFNFGGILAQDSLYVFGGEVKAYTSAVNTWMKYEFVKNGVKANEIVNETVNVTTQSPMPSESVEKSDDAADNTLELMTILSVGCVLFICSMFTFYYVVIVRRRKLEKIEEIEENETDIVRDQELDDVILKRMVNSEDAQPQVAIVDDSSEKEEDSLYVLSDDDDFVIETNVGTRVDNDEKDESLYKKNSDDFVIETNDTATVNTQIADEGEEGFDEYRRIGDILEAIVDDEYEEYLINFRKQMITDKRLFDEKFQIVYNRDNELWKQLIPAVGLRFAFFEKIFGDV